MNKKVWFKILILGALVNLFAASAWAEDAGCGTSADNKEKVVVTDAKCHNAAGVEVACTSTDAVDAGTVK